MKQDPQGGGAPHPVMSCAECGRQSAWNPVGYCSWACFDSRPRDPEAAPLALAYFFDLAPPTQRHNPNP
ncbi:hypothetical protein ACFV4M_39140 [Kitasatospora indigofera]|uniref:hypothetical protein n=1 Tax=Kitasatospora indigofera TaxID=67307 RepID=UPI0036656E3A